MVVFESEPVVRVFWIIKMVQLTKMVWIGKGLGKKSLENYIFLIEQVEFSKIKMFGDHQHQKSSHNKVHVQ